MVIVGIVNNLTFVPKNVGPHILNGKLKKMGVARNDV